MSDKQPNQDSGKQPGNDQTNNIPPTNGNDVSKAGIQLGNIALLMVEGGVVLWMINDLLTVNRPWWGTGLLFGGIALIFGWMAHITSTKVWPNKVAVWVAYFIILALLLLVVLFRAHSAMSQARLNENHPHFTFSLRRIDQPSERVKLTNDFLIETNFYNLHQTMGALIVPPELGHSYITLRFLVRNESSFDADDLLITVMIPEEWECVPDGKWRPTEVDFLVSKLKNASGIYETNKMQAWGLAIPSLLSGNSEDLPDIQLHHVPLYINPSPAMNIMVRAKGSPTDGLNFFLFIFPNSTNGTADFHMPIVVLGTNNNGYSVFPTLDQLRELKK